MTEVIRRNAYTVAETIAATGIGRDNVYRAINDGRLRARKLGRRTLILASDLEAFLQELPQIGAVRS